MSVTLRPLGRAACVLALGLLTACAPGGQQGEHGAGTMGGAGNATGGGASPGAIGEPLVLTLEDDESVLSVSPSGDSLVTVTQPTTAEGQDARAGDVCVRSGPSYETADCADVGGLERSARGAVWNADESLLAFVHPRSHVLDAVCVLDLATGEVRAVTDLEVPRAVPTVLTWLEDGRVGYTRTIDGTEIRAVDPAGTGEATETLQSIADATIDNLLAGEAGVLAEGEIGQERGVFDLGDGTNSPQLLAATPRASAVIAVDGVGERFTVQRWDTHTALAPAVIQATSGDVVELGETAPERFAAAADFSPDDEHLLMLSYVGVRGELAIRDRDLEIVATLEFDRPPGSSDFDGVDWTERGIVLTTGTGGHAQRVAVFPVDLLGS